MKLSFLLLFALAITALTDSAPRVELTRTQSPMPLHFFRYLADPDNFDLKGYPYIVMGTFRDDHPNELPMALALHTSRTFLANCRYFKTFDCSLYPENCLTFPSMTFNEDYPFFSISGCMMDLKFSIANYVRTRPASVYYATSCSGHRFHTGEVMGVVGLSVSDNNYNNINTQNNRFSLYLSEDDTSGELIFGQDNGRAVDINKNITVQSNQDFEMIIQHMRFGNLNHSPLNTAILDMVAPFIGVPSSLYMRILEELEDKYLLRCQKHTVMPECLYPDDINLLPNLTVMFLTSNPLFLQITPNMYLKKLTDNRYQLLLAGLAIDPHHKGLVHVTPNYVNYTILGHPFVKKHYIVFNFELPLIPSITFYEAVQPGGSDSGESSGGIALGAILLGILVIGALAACFWAINRSRRKANEEVRKEMVYGHPPVVRAVDKPVVTTTTTEIREPLMKPTPTLVAT